MLTREQVEDLLIYVDADKIGRWKNNGTKISFCCTVHNDSRPSAGVNIDYVPEGSSEHLQVFNCFSCGAKGNLVSFLQQSLPDQFPTYVEALRFMEKRYDTKIQSSYIDKDGRVKRYEDFYNTEGKRFEQPLSTIAPYRSGKETFKSFYDRGFTKEVVKDFMIGRDLQYDTVTVPIFWEDNKLCGVIGRFIDPNVPSNARFKIYDFPKGDILFPLNHFKPTKRGEIILVGGLYDAIYMHMLGYSNTLTTLNDSMTNNQRELILDYGDTIIDFIDNDTRGREGALKIKNKLAKKVRWKSVEFPDKGKDPCDWSKEQISASLSSSNSVKIRRVN